MVLASRSRQQRIAEPACCIRLDFLIAELLIVSLRSTCFCLRRLQAITWIIPASFCSKRV